MAFIDLTLSAFIVLYSSLYYRDLPLVAREEIDDATGKAKYPEQPTMNLENPICHVQN